MYSQRVAARFCASLILSAANLTVSAFDDPLLDPIPTPISKGSITIELESIVTGVESPNLLTHAGDGSDRLFVVQQPGRIGIIQDGAMLPTPFLDVSARLPSLGLFGLDFDERGLLGLAFHPEFTSNGKLYTFTSEPIMGAADFTVAGLPAPDPGHERHQSVVAEWQVDTTDANVVDTATRRELLRIDNPQFNHNGGMLAFGPQGNLFVSIGDGGARDDVGPGHGLQGNGQDPGNVLGTILRIDPDGNNSANGQYGIPVAAPFSTLATDPTGTIPDEVFAYGFRNPFRFSFDTKTGELIVGDVGQDNIEEIDIVTAGGNFGWRFKEGTFAYDFNDGTVIADLTGIPPGLIDPVAQYDHDEGISVIGGFVYRGEGIPDLYGKYVFGDFTQGSFLDPNGRLFYADLDTGLIQEFIIGLHDRSLGLFVKGFGQDASGELYVLADFSLAANSGLGEVLKIVAAPVPVPASIWFLGTALVGLVTRRRKFAMRQQQG